MTTTELYIHGKEVVRETKKLGEVVAKLVGEREREVSRLSFSLDRCIEDYNCHYNSEVMKCHPSLLPRTEGKGKKSGVEEENEVGEEEEKEEGENGEGEEEEE